MHIQKNENKKTKWIIIVEIFDFSKDWELFSLLIIKFSLKIHIYFISRLPNFGLGIA